MNSLLFFSSFTFPCCTSKNHPPTPVTSCTCGSPTFLLLLQSPESPRSSNGDPLFSWAILESRGGEELEEQKGQRTRAALGKESKRKRGSSRIVMRMGVCEKRESGEGKGREGNNSHVLAIPRRSQGSQVKTVAAFLFHLLLFSIQFLFIYLHIFSLLCILGRGGGGIGVGRGMGGDNDNWSETSYPHEKR